MATTIIVGAGIAGLSIADKLVTAGVRNITIIEKEAHLGGRIITSKKHHVEIGAGRIHSTHTNTLSLIKRFGLETIPIGGASLFRAQGSMKSRPNAFETAFPAIADLLSRLPYTELATHTIRQLLARILGPRQTEALLIEFPYRAEVDAMRADLGLKAFADGIGSPEGYCVVKGGLSTLTSKMEAHLKKAGVNILLNTEVTDVTATGVMTNTGFLEADRIILAIPAWNLKTIPSMRNDPTLKLLGSSALTRIYATYPSTAWFGTKKLVTDSPLRYIIPTGANTLMISYTDGADTRAYRGLKGPELQKAIQRDLKTLFPEKATEIPEPTWIQAYEWSEGTTYWKPGTYDPAQQGKAMLQPKPSTQPNLFICGESFSEKQAWIEGALEHVALLWATHIESSLHPHKRR
jgi:monoamine oxidase